MIKKIAQEIRELFEAYIENATIESDGISAWVETDYDDFEEEVVEILKQYMGGDNDDGTRKEV